jgi:hypothetical protein
MLTPVGASSLLQFTPIKKAAANAAAKVRRWIKEQQINVSEHRVTSRKSSIHLKSVANGMDRSQAIGLLSGCSP